MLPSLSKNVVQRMNKIWSQFLWNQKNPKIAWSILCSPKKYGGLGLSHLIKRDHSLKIQGVPIYMKDSIVTTLVDFFLNNKVGSLIWECNIKVTDCCKITIFKGFWVDVLKAWSLFNYTEPQGVDEILEHVLWFNSHIKIAKEFFFDKDIYNNGVMRVKDLLNSSLEFMSVSQFRNRFPSCNYMRFLSLMHAIPPQWKRALGRGTPSIMYRQPKFTHVTRGDPIVRLAYKELHTNIFKEK